MLDVHKIMFFKYQINAGYISSITTLLKFFNTTAISLLLVSSTNFFDLAVGLSRLRIPKRISIQLILMYRFIFLFIGDIINTLESIRSRSFTNKNVGWKEIRNIFTAFFIKALYRSEEVYASMVARNFDPSMIVSKRRFVLKDIVYVIISLSYITFLRVI